MQALSTADARILQALATTGMKPEQLIAFAFQELASKADKIGQLNTRASDKPLCLFVGSNWPHVPWPTNTAGYDPAMLRLPAGSVDTPLTREWRARYAAAVTKADDELGATERNTTTVTAQLTRLF